MVIYVPGTEETDQKKQNMALQQLGGATSTLQTSVAANTANIATIMGAYVVSIAGNSGAFTLSNGITNSTNDIRLNVNGLTEDTAPDTAADFILTYDNSASAHKKVKPKNLNYGFSAHKNATAQTGITSGADTKVTFTTEVFDVGGFYDAANSKWTPPAGRVCISAQVFTTGTITSGTATVCAVWKNGAVLKEGFTYPGSANVGVASVTIIDDANGTDFYEIYVRQATSAGTVTVDGTVKWSFVSGTIL